MPINGERKPLGTYDTWEEAEAVRLSALEALDDTGDADVSSLRVIGNAWLDMRDRAHELRHIESYRGSWNNYVLPHKIANMPIRAIRPADLDDLVRSMREKDLAVQTIRNCLNVVRGVIKSAMRRGLVKTDPFAGGVPIPREKRTEESWTFLTMPEQAALLDAAENVCGAMTKHLIAFAMFTGLRAGELATLRLADCHADHVVVRYGSVPDLSTKSGKPRVVHLNGPAKAALETWRAGLNDYTKSKRYPNGYNPHGLCFVGQRGRFRRQAHIIRWADWKAIRESPASRARDGMTFDTRRLPRSCPGCGAERGASKMRARFLGHTDIKTTMRYAHIASTAISDAAKATNGGGNGWAERPKVAPRGARFESHRPGEANRPGNRPLLANAWGIRQSWPIGRPRLWRSSSPLQRMTSPAPSSPART